MNTLHAVLFGLVEGITEYLPVSANGHLLILGRLLRDEPGLVASFGIILQAAPMLAVLVLYHRSFLSLFDFSPNPGGVFRGSRGWKMLAASTLPVLILGFLFSKPIKQYLFHPLPTAIALACGGLVILWVERHHDRSTATSVDKITLGQAFGIGLCQCLALIPGVSRSGATIIGGLWLGLDRKTSAEFSFFAGVPVFAAAAGLEAYKFHKAGLLRPNLGFLAAGFLVAFVLALVSVKLLMKALSRMTFEPFAWYRLAMSPVYWFLVVRL